MPKNNLRHFTTSQRDNHFESLSAILLRENKVNKIKHLSDTYTSQPTTHFLFLSTYFVLKTDLAIIVEAKVHQLNFSNNFLCVYAVINHIAHCAILYLKIPTPHTYTALTDTHFPPPTLPELLHLHQLFTLLHTPLRIPCFNCRNVVRRKTLRGTQACWSSLKTHCILPFSERSGKSAAITM